MNGIDTEIFDMRFNNRDFEMEKLNNSCIPTPKVALYFRSSYFDEIMRVDRIARDEFELEPIMDDNKSVVAIYGVPISVAVHLAAVIGDGIIPEVIPIVDVSTLNI